jgi:TonB family protein
MKTLKLISLLILFSLEINGQTRMKVRFNNSEGIKHFRSGNLQDAITSFTKSIDLLPNAEAFYYRAKVYFELNHMQEYCDDIEMASCYLFKDAKQLTNNTCYITDTIYVDKLNQQSDSLSYEYMKISQKSKLKNKLFFTVKNRKEEVIFAYSIIDQDTIYGQLPVDMPEFPNGEQGLLSYLSKSIRYPDKAKAAGITGTVFVTFIIDESGEVKNAHIWTGIGGGCDEEALRVINLMPKWKPGLYNNTAVKVQYGLPIRFTLR